MRGARGIRMWFVDKNTLRLTKPYLAPLSDVESFVRSNLKWIDSRRASAPKLIRLDDWLTLNPKVWFFGREYKITLLQTKTKSPYHILNDDTSELAICRRIGAFGLSDTEKIFCDLARTSIEKRVEEIAGTYGLEYSKVSLRNQRGRWGSCSSRGTLSFNWRLALLDAKFQDYIIFHEFAHTKFMDHSVSFWIYLSRICPDAKRLDRQISSMAAEIFSVGLGD